MSVSSAMRAQAVRMCLLALGRRLFEGRRVRAGEQLGSLQPEVEALQREHSDDPEAVNRAVSDLYRTRDVKPFASCGWSFATFALPLAGQLPALWSPQNQVLSDAVAGTVVIVDK